MSDVATLLAEFVDALNAGSAPEAFEYLQRAESSEQRVELAEGIEAALELVTYEASHPRDADGTFVLGLPHELIARAARATWPQAVPSWRRSAELSAEQLAERVLDAGGIEKSQSNLSAAERWIAAIEAGAESVRSVSERAREALATALGVTREAFDLAGDFEPGAAVAFRADADARADEDAASGLIEIAAALDAAMAGVQEPTEVDSWFSA